MIARLLSKLLRWRTPKVHVLLVYEDGGQATLGPMDQFTAEVFLVQVLNPNPVHFQRRVARARLVLP